MRKKKNGEARLAACEEMLLGEVSCPMTDPASSLGMTGAPVFLEIGAGKGGFAVKMAQRHTDAAYFAMERVTDCVVLAAEKAKSAEPSLTNLRFITDTADNLARLFAPGTVDHIFLNFSDPWSKKGYAKRRLTHRRYLALYFSLLRDGGKITFKTDNVGLFDFTLLEFADIGITPDFVTRDLHHSSRAEGNVMTEYETAFSEQGMSINMVEVTKPVGYSLTIPKELCADYVRQEKN
jgi:tRNA (guanine-N7-)-methyltransferase